MQSRAMSMVEAVTNVAVGFGLALGVQLALFPMLSLEASLGEHLSISAVFTVVSIARGYALRRVFERLRR